MRSWLRGACARTDSPSLRFESLEQRLTLTGAPTVVDFQAGSTAWTSDFVNYLHTHGMGDGGYRVPTGSSSQVKSLSWSNIDKLSVTFSEDVHVLENHLSLTGVSVASVSFSHFEYDPRSFTATWTLSAALPKNSYRFELDGDGAWPVRDLTGSALDGEWTTSTTNYPSGNGTSGGDFAFDFRVLPGDFNQNNGIDFSDYTASTSRNGLTTSSGSYAPFADIDGSGSHTTADSSSIQAKMYNAYPAGSPVGASNDAPTSVGWRALSVNANAVDAAFDIWGDFADAETADNALTYQITSTSNASVWSSQSINAVTGKLHLTPVINATGFSTIIVTATDSVGQKSFTKYIVDLGSVNLSPEVEFYAEQSVGDRLIIHGFVSDDGYVEGLMVQFNGAITGRAYVKADGSFTLVVELPEVDWDWAYATIADWHGLSPSLPYKGWAGV